MIRNIAWPAGILASVLALSGCGHTPQGTNTSIYNPQTANTVPQLNGQSSSGSLITIGKGAGGSQQGGTGIQVNAYLWRATLDTLSFMPLVSADPFGGVIITDWYSPPATPDERFKANAYILSQQLSANALQVSLFHQVQQNGQWVDASVDPATVSGLEDRILARAANLRAGVDNARN